MEVEVKGKKQFVLAKKGVLLAAGGFSRNPEMLGRYNPPLENAVSIAGAGTQGDGVLMGLAVGADMLDVAYIKATYGFKLNPKHIDELSIFIGPVESSSTKMQNALLMSLSLIRFLVIMLWPSRKVKALLFLTAKWRRTTTKIILKAGY